MDLGFKSQAGNTRGLIPLAPINKIEYYTRKYLSAIRIRVRITMKGITTTFTLVNKNSKMLEGMFELIGTLRMEPVLKKVEKRQRKGNLLKNEIEPLYLKIL